MKIGHGGTLDPIATGVLIIGVGSGTKQLQSFLNCTKTYEATVLFGAATDSYDATGKMLAKAPYDHVTKQLVEDALSAFKGKIMQRPPIYSALRIEGKRLYEYAREGKEIPREIRERPMEVKELEIVEWLDASDHAYKWPSDEAGHDVKMVAQEMFHLKETSSNPATTPDSQNKSETPLPSSEKRKRIVDEDDDLVKSRTPSKRKEEDPSVNMSGALQISDEEAPTKTEDHELSLANTEQTSNSPPPKPGPPAVKLRMTVTSGFYVRSFCYDLGKKVGSLAFMCDLVRTRQGDFTLGQNVLEYEDIGKGEECWAPKVERLLDEWRDQNVSEHSEEDLGEPDIT